MDLTNYYYFNPPLLANTFIFSQKPGVLSTPPIYERYIII